MAGLVGAGRSEVAQAIFGVDAPLAGTLTLDGQTLTVRSAQDAIRHGIYLAPEDRRKSGVIVDMSIRDNITLPALGRYAVRRPDPARRGRTAAAEDASRSLRVKAPVVDFLVRNLSGGNQQKVVLAKWLSLGPKVLIFDEPTRGIDVGAKAEIYDLMREPGAGGRRHPDDQQRHGGSPESERPDRRHARGPHHRLPAPPGRQRGVRHAARRRRRGKERMITKNSHDQPRRAAPGRAGDADDAAAAARQLAQGTGHLRPAGRAVRRSPASRNHNFFGVDNLQDLARLVGIYGIFSIGAGIVIITGGIDLSVGSVFALEGVLAAMMLTRPPLAARCSPSSLCLALTMGLGLFHGLLITRVPLQPFIVTLCGLLFYRGIARFIAGDATEGFGDGDGLRGPDVRWRPASFLGVPAPFVVLLVIAVVMWVVLHRSVYGRYLYAVGRNEEAARYSGHQLPAHHRQRLRRRRRR